MGSRYPGLKVCGEGMSEPGEQIDLYTQSAVEGLNWLGCGDF